MRSGIKAYICSHEVRNESVGAFVANLSWNVGGVCLQHYEGLLTRTERDFLHTYWDAGMQRETSRTRCFPATQVPNAPETTPVKQATQVATSGVEGLLISAAKCFIIFPLMNPGLVMCCPIALLHASAE